MPLKVDNAMTTAERVNELLNALYTAETSDDCVAMGDKLAEAIKAEGVRSLADYGVLSNLDAAAKDKKNGLAREAAMLGFDSIFRIVGAMCVPYALPHAPTILDLLADKGQVVRDAATLAINSLFNAVSPMAVSPVLLPILFAHGLPSAKKWQTRIGALSLLSSLAKRAPDQIGDCLVTLIPAVSECINDTRTEVSFNFTQRWRQSSLHVELNIYQTIALDDQVSKAGYDTMTAICSVVGNNDLIPKIPILVSCIAHPTEIVPCVEKLSSTTFVAEVTGPALAILVPILVRALNERSMAVQRSTCIIIDNLCKLVRDPAEAGQFLPELLPGLDKIIDIAAFPEVRALATAARNTLIKAGGGVIQSAEKSEEVG
jgi:elongation factor 3